MGESITIFPYNILESGTVTVTGTPDTGYPEARLWDRSRNLFWKDTVTQAKTFLVDQGAAGSLAVDLLWIAGHNFDGEDMQFQWSADNFAADTNDAVTDWTQSGYSDIVKTLTALTKRYWRVTVSSIINPMCAEICMSKGYEFGVQAKLAPRHGFAPNVQWSRSIGGQESSVKLGEDKRSRRYILRLDSSGLADFETVIGYLNGWAYPFLFKDKDGNYFMARFSESPNYKYFNKNYTEIDVSIIEML